MKNTSFFILYLILAFTRPAYAETAEELKDELEVKKQIIELQRQRIESLEAELSGRKIAPPKKSDESPEIASTDPESDRALERALVRRGSAVLAPYTAELAPSLFWRHSGSDAISSTDDLYGAGLDARIGLPNGWMIGAAMPYLYRDIDGIGNNSGIGDASATVWKAILAESDSSPALVASLRYTSPTGENLGDNQVTLGNGFHQITALFSTVKSIDPIALFGDISYTHYLDENISGLSVDRSDAIGIGFGTSLAATPDVSLSTSLNFAFEDEIEINGVEVNGSSTTVGELEIGAGVVLTRDILLNIVGSFGITDDSPDMTLGVSLPVRF